MKRIRSSELAALSPDQQRQRLRDLRSDLAQLRSKAARGTLKKELGEIKSTRRNIARVLTAMSATRRQNESSDRMRPVVASSGSEQKRSSDEKRAP